MRQPSVDSAPHILLVEDDALLREVSADILAEAGFLTREAACAAEALALLQDPAVREEIAAIVTDIEMPGELDGLGLAGKVRQLWPRIRVVITSGAASGAAAARRQEALFLAKPFRGEGLIAAVQSALAATETTPAL